MLLGINGSGKSSLFDAFNHRRRGIFVEYYHTKVQDDAPNQVSGLRPTVTVDYHEGSPPNPKRAFYIRSAYRNDSHFQSTNINVSQNVEEEEYARLELLVNDDPRVRQNYNRIVFNAVSEVFKSGEDEVRVSRKEIRETLIGPLRESMQRVFSDLVLRGVGDPQNGGTFLFEKGRANGFPYVNLSAGEKDAFDLLLDIHLRRDTFSDAVYCVDAPDLYMHTKLQGCLLEELVRLIPETSQLWIAPHSLGMINKAMQLPRNPTCSVVFLDFSGHDYDKPVALKPIVVNRLYWKKILAVAVDDLASLVAPSRVVICEGRPLGTDGKAPRREYDAKCLGRIFSEEFPETEFVSVGNADSVIMDNLALGASLKKVIAGMQLIRVIDRDGCTEREIADLARDGVRVLRRRQLENYLMDDDVLKTLCDQLGKSEKLEELRAAVAKAFESCKLRGKESDDAKAAAGPFFSDAKKILEMQNLGSNWEAFFCDHMAGALRPGLPAYNELKVDIFGEASG